MNEFKADLHCHTNCSDGSASPEEIISLAIQAGLSGLSITDHDSIHAYSTALPVAKALSFLLLSGVEFSAVHRGESVHILGYSFCLNSPDILNFCDQHHKRRTHRNRAILERLGKLGMPIDESDLGTSPTLGRPHIALAMISKGYVTSVKEAFIKYLGDGKPGYVSGGCFSVEETINVIHGGKGVALIAHPHLIKNNSLVEQLLKMPFDGLEAYYGRFHLDKQQRWIDIAKKKGWMVSGGSDFHGSIKPEQPLGSSWVDRETFDLYYSRFIENNP
jgi:3',5'-nucleoside bisphosphate phosphatase